MNDGINFHGLVFTSLTGSYYQRHFYKVIKIGIMYYKLKCNKLCLIGITKYSLQSLLQFSYVIVKFIALR